MIHIFCKLSSFTSKENQQFILIDCTIIQDKEKIMSRNNRISTGYCSALEDAVSYYYKDRFSKKRIYKRLTKESGYSAKEAKYAIDNLDSNYFNNATARAKIYYGRNLSKKAIYNRLLGIRECFSEEEAKLAVDNFDDAEFKLNALREAQLYCATSDKGLSSQEIYALLVSKLKFTYEEAQFAIENLNSSFNIEAFKRAEIYSKEQNLSKKAIYNHLLNLYDGLSCDEAQYIVDILNANFKKNALERAKIYFNDSHMSIETICQNLIINEFFTQEEANYAIKELKIFIAETYSEENNPSSKVLKDYLKNGLNLTLQEILLMSIFDLNINFKINALERAKYYYNIQHLPMEVIYKKLVEEDCFEKDITDYAIKNLRLFIKSTILEESKKLGERIKWIREELELTQNEFANQLGISNNTLARYESGRQNINEYIISNICRTFNVNYDWLTKGESTMFLTRSSKTICNLMEEYNIDSAQLPLIKAYLKSTPEEKAELLQLAYLISGSIEINNKFPLVNDENLTFSKSIQVPKTISENVAILSLKRHRNPIEVFNLASKHISNKKNAYITHAYDSNVSSLLKQTIKTNNEEFYTISYLIYQLSIELNCSMQDILTLSDKQKKNIVKDFVNDKYIEFYDKIESPKFKLPPDKENKYFLYSDYVTFTNYSILNDLVKKPGQSVSVREFYSDVDERRDILRNELPLYFTKIENDSSEEARRNEIIIFFDSSMAFSKSSPFKFRASSDSNIFEFSYLFPIYYRYEYELFRDFENVNCSRCGTEYSDYSEWTDTEWICPQCQKKNPIYDEYRLTETYMPEWKDFEDVIYPEIIKKLLDENTQIVVRDQHKIVSKYKRDHPTELEKIKFLKEILTKIDGNKITISIEHKDL